MIEIPLTTDTLKAALTILILAGAVYGFVSERVAPDVTALLAILALLITGILTPSEAFSGFSHPATISVAAVLVLSAAIERTGALNFVARRVLAPLGRSEFLFTAAIMLVIAFLSAFINNTAAVAVFIPIVLDACRRHGFGAGRVLMPMSHAATFGGMCTLVGTSTNLVAHEFALSQNLRGFSMFEMGKIGLPMLVVGFAYILLIGRRFLPEGKQSQSVSLEKDKFYIAELIVPAESSWVEREINPEHFERDYDLELIGIRRDGQVVDIDDETPRIVFAEDLLLVRGALENIFALAAKEKLELHRPERVGGYIDRTEEALSEQNEDVKPDMSELKESKLILAEVVVLSTSGLLDRTLKESRFSERFDAIVLALRRRGDVRDSPSNVRLHAGDVLIVEGEADALQALAETKGFLVIGSPERREERPGKLIITLVTMIAVIIIVSLGLLPVVTAATAGCVTLILTRCLHPREVYKAIDLSLVFLLAGSLSLGVALEKTGLTNALASSLTGLTGLTGPFVVMVGFFLVAVIFSELLSNSGTVALLGPIAISSAMQMGINPMALLAAVTFGSSAAFAMPIGYQTSLMIYGSGGYSFKDFVRMGIPLDLFLAIIALLLIPYFWPLSVAR